MPSEPEIRSRIKELRYVSAGQLRPHPANWRTHPPRQRRMLRDLLARIGYAAPLIARETDLGELELIDGHLRSELTPDGEVPVLVLDVSREEAQQLLLALDPLAGLAGTDGERLDALLAEMPADEEIAETLRALHGREDRTATTSDWSPIYEVVVVCGNEAEQQEVYERLTADGRRCRLSTIL